ncbi:hypothetical protein Trydic_g23511 [Trypoxylus dichotomus]
MQGVLSRVPLIRRNWDRTLFGLAGIAVIESGCCKKIHLAKQLCGRVHIVVMSKQKRTTLTLKEKLDALKRLGSGESVYRLSMELCVGKATICDWKKNRVKLEQS